MIERRPVTFFSDGLRLDGEVYLPSDLRPGERRPAVIPLSGYQGLKGLQPARFARALVPLGYVCLAFDYRGFGRSEGQRGRLVPQEQVEDARAAISFLEPVPEVDPMVGSEVSLESADLLFRFRPADVVGRIAPRPLLLFHGQDNRLHSVDESHDLHSHAHEPKRLVVLEGSGHTDWMFDDHPTFRHVIQLTHGFIAGAVAAQ